MKQNSPLHNITVKIRDARSNEIEQLQNIDLKSSELFLGTGLIDFGPSSVQLTPIPEDRIRRGLGDNLIWTAVNEKDEPIGFALCDHQENCLYLDQVSVLPEHGRKGIGEKLVLRAIEETRALGYKSISLSTFRDVPWNGKFYRRLGFKEIHQRKLENWQLDLTQRQRTTMDISKRCFMQKSVKRLFF